MKKLIGAVLIPGMMSSSVLAGGFAASVSDFSGKVMVNKGDGFVPLVSGVSLNVGDKVLVGEGSFAVLAYEECAVSLSKPAVISVSKDAPCNVGALSDEAAVVTPAAYTGPAIAAPLIIGGIGVAVVGTLLLTGALNDDNDPVSGP
jgi:hypothetical protein